MRGSQLRQPSKIGTPGKGLHEMSASENNARTAGQPSMPPPTLKHKPSGLPEPMMKRKTLAERGGEPIRPNVTAPPTSRIANAAVTSIAQAGPRPTSFSSSLSSAASRTASAVSRNTSTSSTRSVVGTMGRSAGNKLRSQTSMSHMRTAQGPPNRVARPASATGDHEASVSEQPVLGKRKGRVPSYLSSATPGAPGSFQSFAQRQRQKSQAVVISSGPFKTPARQHVQPPAQQIHQHVDPSDQPLRELSLTSAFNKMTLGSESTQKHDSMFNIQSNQENNKATSTPSHIPRPVPSTPNLYDPPAFLPPINAQLPPSPSPVYKSCRSQHSRPASPQRQFLNRFSNTEAPLPAWDTKGRLEDVESLYATLKGQMESAAFERNGLEETISLYKTRINELEEIRTQLTSSTDALKTDLEEAKVKLSATNAALDDARRNHTYEVDDLTRKHRNEMEDVNDRHRRERERLRKEAQDEFDSSSRAYQDELDKLIRQHRDDLNDLETRLKAEAEEQRSQRLREVQELNTQIALQQQDTSLNLSSKDREAQTIRDELSRTTSNLECERALNDNLKKKLAEADANNIAIDSSMRTMKAKIDFLESDNQAQSQAFADLNQKLQDAINAANEAHEKLRTEETLRRKLHNQVQELKGNIRVFCRVRPTLSEPPGSAAKIHFPDGATDGRELVVQGPEQKSALGKVSTATHNFAFDKVFGPAASNAAVFDEISQLVQSALDGYNVCIFCYGQTGSGKTFTMSAPGGEGMIARAVAQIYASAQALEPKGWSYTMHGSFVEVYNETLHDLLGSSDEFVAASSSGGGGGSDADNRATATERHRITHDPARGTTEVAGVQRIVLDGPARVEELLARAARNRSVAATKANERSSRSHSVFMLRLVGTNAATGERSEGVLNLVDLAGSERLAQSGAEGARLKETQNINKSLSCLGDVIGALGQGKEGGHVPYRNSKLTYLLQQSLGGNSKTLMFVNISPLQAHLGETLTSLKFATKVHNTHIGTAKRQTKVKD
ncbi:MAG: kinesin-like nuclear fusion protein [Bathelium mastoideum]|nr:MAG: kinesin-like nuclear fusion protein [Bathelium mastoideum]KAI9691622.1 MAG: kinesin-like nuclear fusion protein [Bathelium mastoideum]